MSRLPVVNSDSNNWGTILNDFLNVSHSSDGTLKNLFINLKDTCAIDGVTDDTVPFAAALTAAAAAGKILLHPGGTLLTGPQTLLSGVYIWGVSSTISTIKLKNGSNADLFSAGVGNINPSGAFATGANGGLINWGFRDIRLDGNMVNQSGTSYVMRAYGQTKEFINVVFQYGRSGCAVFDWNGNTGQAVQAADTGESFNSAPNVQFINCMFVNSGGEGLLLAGGTDNLFVDCLFGSHNSNSVHIGPNAAGAQFSNCHAWSPDLGTPTGGAVAWLIEGTSCTFTNCEAEGSPQTQVAILANTASWNGGRVFAGGNTHRGTGIQIGQQAGQTPYDKQILVSAGVTTYVSPTNCHINTMLNDNAGANGAIWFANDGGNTVIADIYQTSGLYWTGTKAAGTTAILNGHGLTAGYGANNGPIAEFATGQFEGFLVKSASGHDTFFIDGISENVIIGPNHQLFGVDGAYATTWLIKGGTFAPLSSTSAAATATGGTITTSGVGIARVAPTGNITGVIVQAGTFEGQQITIRNESAFTVTMAVSGTSHVAGGVAVVIAANRSQLFSWNNTGALWY